MDTKEQIISESLRLFNQDGEELVGVREIARTLGISPGNLSYHFPRKEDIIGHHLAKLIGELDILIQAYLQEEEDLYRLPELIKSCLERQYDYRGLFHATNGSTMESLSDRITTSISKMGRQGQLQMTEEDVLFLSGVINFQLKYWLAGIALSPDKTGRDSLIQAQLLTIVKLLLLFASPNGRIHLLKFKAHLMAHV